MILKEGVVTGRRRDPWGRTRSGRPEDLGVEPLRLPSKEDFNIASTEKVEAILRSSLRSTRILRRATYSYNRILPAGMYLHSQSHPPNILLPSNFYNRILPSVSTYTRHLHSQLHPPSLTVSSSSAQPLQSHPTCGHVLTFPTSRAASTLPPLTLAATPTISHGHILRSQP
jgi:hypothetical protein